MRLLNFKGIRDLEVEFGEKLTLVKGRNGLGKTTVFDAFTWLLFGKNSENAKAFSVKTLDKDGNAIPRIPHEVSAVLEWDGARISLTRRYNEKWVKRRGQAEEEFTGHEEERLFNDVPCSVKEWNEKIGAICSEETFKTITSPAYFVSQKKEVQRAALMRMAGGVDDKEIAKGDEGLEKILELAEGKTLDELKREIAAKKKRVKAEADGIPDRIDERRRDLSAMDDTDRIGRPATKEEAEKAQERIKEIDAQISGASEAVKAAQERIRERQKEIFNMSCSIDKRKREIEQKATDSWYRQEKDNQRLKNEIAILEGNVANAEERQRALKDYIGTLEAKSEELRKKWYEKNAERIAFKEDDFRCPLCGRPFEADDIERRRADMEISFNSQKAEELRRINAEGVENKTLIDRKRAELDKLEDDITGWKIETNQKRMEISELPRPDVDDLIENDEGLKGLQKALSELKEKAVEGASEVDNTALQEERTRLISVVADYRASLEMDKIRKDGERRIAELEERMRELSAELAGLEGVEFDMQRLAKARITAVEEKINSMFRRVRFKLYEQQINGGETETCEATVDGVPYSDLNNAGRINAGLDIISAIVEKEGVSAPIFVDNAESVNEVADVAGAQMILLRVTEDERLTIENLN